MDHSKDQGDQSHSAATHERTKNDHSYYGAAAEPWTPAGNLNALDEERMTSPAAQNARARSAEIMATLKKGEPGDADKLMGDRDLKGSGLLPGKGLLQKLVGKSSKEPKTTK